MSELASHLSFWGKGRPLRSGNQNWHPVAYHCVDVAAVCEQLLLLNPSIAWAFGNIGGTDAATARGFLVKLAVLHDIGKFAIGFQAKMQELYPAILGAFPRNPPAGDHTTIGRFILWETLRPELRALAPAVDCHAWQALLPAVAGHHGRPVCQASTNAAEIGQAAVAAAHAFTAEAVQAFSVESFPGEIDDVAAKRLCGGLRA
jgi:CRISPR-associated endonuclease/helicase Cas3